MQKYDPKKIEKKWQKYWTQKKINKTSEDKKKPKFYCLDMFPYPSGEGLHIGHPKGYTATDVYSRYKRMQGFNVIHPMGWDAFGLPAENYALKNKIHPKKAVDKNVKRFKEQLSSIGFNYDWDREINTTDPKYYKWTQWIFLKMFENGLAYESNEPINWCPSCKTGLANEDLEDGKCERCGSDVEQKPIRQWVLKITDYADRLLKDLDKLDWPESIKESQKNWIGRSEGYEVSFPLKNDNEKIKIFTTRLDTIFGATYLVLAPENKIIEKIKERIINKEEVKAYIEATSKKTEMERTSLNKEKSGVELRGIKAINPANGEEISVWIADYVLNNYGTGAIMAVPAHDERDFEFAKKFGLPVKQVIAPLFIDSVNPPKKEKKWSSRQNVQIIVKHPDEDKIIQLQWKKQPWKTLVIGGVEEGESYEEAARRELLEETGYKNIKNIRQIGWQMESHFYAAHKDINRKAFTKVFEVELKDLEKEELSQEEKELHEVVWVQEKEIVNFAPMSEKPHILEFFIKKEGPYVKEGILINSSNFSDLDWKKGQVEIAKKIKAKKVVKYKLKDWVFSRQRYWGEPIPLIHCEKCGVLAVPEKSLPVELPKVKSYAPTGTGESPLAGISKWVNVMCPKCKSVGKRETNTMPQWAGSCWYYLRYMDPNNSKFFVDKKKEKYWSPVDLYVGGAEHATRHLIYARFWHKFLFDLGLVSSQEPFLKLHNVGLIMGSDGRKMSKRLGNVVNPDDIVENYGADSLRVYIMFIGPFSDSGLWNNNNLAGIRRFLERVWRLEERVEKKDFEYQNKETTFLIHKTIKKVGEDVEGFSFNTAISAMMILANVFEKEEKIKKVDFENFLLLLAPFAPHMTEELWSKLGNKNSIHLQSWPKYEKAKVANREVTIAVSVNGKVRGNFRAQSGIDRDKVEKIAFAMEEIKKWISDKEIKKVIFVKDRVLNIVV